MSNEKKIDLNNNNKNLFSNNNVIDEISFKNKQFTKINEQSNTNDILLKLMENMQVMQNNMMNNGNQKMNKNLNKKNSLINNNPIIEKQNFVETKNTTTMFYHSISQNQNETNVVGLEGFSNAINFILQIIGSNVNFIKIYDSIKEKYKCLPFILSFGDTVVVFDTNFMNELCSKCNISLNFINYSEKKLKDSESSIPNYCNNIYNISNTSYIYPITTKIQKVDSKYYIAFHAPSVDEILKIKNKETKRITNLNILKQGGGRGRGRGGRGRGRGGRGGYNNNNQQNYFQ